VISAASKDHLLVFGQMGRVLSPIRRCAIVAQKNSDSLNDQHLKIQQMTARSTGGAEVDSTTSTTGDPEPAIRDLLARPTTFPVLAVVWL
jgi:hypothetical protein